MSVRAWRLSSAWWLGLLALAPAEMAAHGVMRARVPADGDWQRAAAYVDRHWQDGDAVTVAPSWAGPHLRRVLGHRITLAMAGRSDLVGYRRLWGLSIRGARPADAPDASAETAERFGRVSVRRWALPPSSLRYDFVEHLRSARVEARGPEGPHACPWRTMAPPAGGGLGKGVLPPRKRFVCDPRSRWHWVGTTVIEDLSLSPRYCVWQHPSGPRPLRVSFDDVPLGERLVFYAGLYYEHERQRRGAPIQIAVRIAGRELGQLTHHDGDGWTRNEWRLPPELHGSSAEVSFDTWTAKRRGRSLCWQASMRGEPAR